MNRLAKRKPTQILWIICEGETEKYYFQKLKSAERVERINVRVTTNTSALKIVDYACNFVQRDRDFENGDRVFCVFDRDSNSNEQPQQASQKAKEKGIEIIFSNPSFEFWLLLHFAYLSQRFENDQVLSKLRKYLPKYPRKLILTSI